MTSVPFWPYPRHLGRQIARCLQAHHPKPVQCAAFSFTALVASGFTVGTVSAEPASGTTFYISSSTGNDSNSCLSPSTACQTIGKANSLNYPAGSTLAFLAGDRIPVPTPLSLSSSNVHGALTITSYGSGTCNILAKVFTGCATLQAMGADNDAIDIHSLNNVTVQNLRLLGGTNNAVFQRGAGVRYDSANRSLSNFSVQNVEASEFATGIYLRSSSLNGGTILNNWVHGASVTSAMDTGIWVRFSQTNILIQGNVVENIGGKPQSVAGVYPGGTGNGILIADGASHVIDQYNVTRFNGANTTTCGGPVGNWTHNSSHVTIQFNESYGNAPSSYSAGCDWDGFALDAGTQNSALQYNYSHDNYGAGFLAYMNRVGNNNWQNNVIRYNISVNDSANSNFGSFTFNGGGDNASSVFNNTAYNHGQQGNTQTGLCSNSFGGSATTFLNNICYNDNGNVFVYSTGGDYVPADGNDYFRIGPAPSYFIQYNGTTYSTFAAYQSGSGQDAHGTTVNPGFAVMPSLPAPTCYVDGTVPSGPQPCPSGYKLSSGSAIIGAGLNVTSTHSVAVGTRDYYGNAVPNGVGSGYSIGADGGNP